ncbi:MAG: phage shock protein PspA [Oceanobacter sp.]
MSIFSRMSDIINSNITALLDKAEDPQKMVRLMIQEMEETLVEVRSSTARVIADRKTTVRRMVQIQDAADEWENKAMLAIRKGREELARAALAEKQKLERDITAIESELTLLDEHLASLEKEVSQLQAKLDDAKARQKAMLLRKDSVENRMKVKRQYNKASVDEAFEKFERYERKMDDLEGQLESMDVGQSAQADLKAQIDQLAEDDAVNDELARLKNKMSGKN